MPQKIRTLDNLIDVFENPNLLDKLGFTTVGSGDHKPQEFSMAPKTFGSRLNVGSNIKPPSSQKQARFDKQKTKAPKDKKKS